MSTCATEISELICCLIVSVVSDSFVTPRTVARQAPLSMVFPRQEYRSELPFPSPGDLPDPGIESECPLLAGRFLTTEPPEKPTLILLQPCITIYKYTHSL